MRLLTLVSILLLLLGCKSNPVTDLPDPLYAKVRTFEDVVRWGALEKMYLFLKYDPEAPPVQIPPGLDNVRVTGYEEAGRMTEISPGRWAQTVVIDYVLTDRQVVRQVVDQQVWVSDDEGKSWYRENPVPEFR